MLKGGAVRHCLGAHAKANWPTLHLNDGVMSVFPCGSCCQADDDLCLDRAHHLLKGERRKVMALMRRRVLIFLQWEYTK